MNNKTENKEDKVLLFGVAPELGKENIKQRLKELVALLQDIYCTE
ncbi:hypothetical protein VBM90_01555 [Mycoplasma sp. 2704]|nr:hypothetical protein [Mycoplasma sp. 2704]MEA4134487.1 hypothetical protein [Mycoplasma sp. 2704]